MAYAGVTYPGGDPGQVQRRTQVGTYTGPRGQRLRAPRVYSPHGVRLDATAPTVSIMRYPPGYAGYVPENLGFSLRIGGSIGKVLGNVQKAVTKGAVDTAHAVGNAATSSVGKAVLGGALALTGVGLPAAIAIGAGTQAAGGLLKSGGGIKGVETGLVQGAVTGAAGSIAGTVGRAAISKFQSLTAPSAAQTAQQVTSLDQSMAAQVPGSVAAVNTAGGNYLSTLPPVAPGLPTDTSGLPAVASSITSGSGDSAVGVQQVGATALTAVQEKAKAAAQAAADAAAAQGAQIASLQAQLAQAQAMGNTAHAADVQTALTQAQKQGAHASAAADAANKGLNQLGKHSASSSTSDIQNLLNSILNNQQTAQATAQAPNTAQGTQGLPPVAPVPDGSQPSQVQEAGLLGGIPMPVLLVGGALLAYLAVSGGRGRR